MAEQGIPPLGVLSPEAQKKPGAFGGFFGGGKVPEEGPSPTTMSSVIDEVNNASRRVRVLEDRYTNLRNKLQIIEDNMLEIQKKYHQDLQAINDDVMRIKRALSDLDTKTGVIVKELQLNAKKEDVDVIQKYLDLWEPVHFVTREQVDRMINEAIEIAAIKLAQKMPEYEAKMLKPGR